MSVWAKLAGARARYSHRTRRVRRVSPTLILAFVFSLSLHLVTALGVKLSAAPSPATSPLSVQLRPLPPPQARLQPAPLAPSAVPEKKPAARPPIKPPPRESRALELEAKSATPPSVAPEVPQNAELGEGDAAAQAEESPNEFTPESAIESAPQSDPEPPTRLPASGAIYYRVDRGDSNFMIGRSYNHWDINAGRYRLTSWAETNGLIAFFKPVRVDMESRGKMVSTGLQPEHFFIRRNGEASEEQAIFDWQQMTVRYGAVEDSADSAVEALDPGAQDLLSLNFQLGYLSLPELGGSLPVATGKKYERYQLEVVGDEEIEVPAGRLKTLHVRAPGDNATEFWLAYDYLLLPVKIRHVDRRGGSFVQVATQIELDTSPELGNSKQSGRR